MAKTDIQKLHWRHRLRAMRFMRGDETTLRKHRAMYQLRLHRGGLLVALLIPAVFNLALFLEIDRLIHFWHAVLDFWVARLDIGAQVQMRAFDLGYFDLWVPTVALEGQLPSAATWWITATACVILFFLSYLIPPNRGLPLVYMLRAVLLIQTTALLYFAFLPASFPHMLGDYVTSNLFVGVMLMLLIPWILGVTYYLFEFSLLKKIALTLLIIGFFVVAMPLQYLLHATLIAHGSLLFMPVLYLVFGLFIDVMVFVALYSYGMTW